MFVQARLSISKYDTFSFSFTCSDFLFCLSFVLFCLEFKITRELNINIHYPLQCILDLVSKLMKRQTFKTYSQCILEFGFCCLWTHRGPTCGFLML